MKRKYTVIVLCAIVIALVIRFVWVGASQNLYGEPSRLWIYLIGIILGSPFVVFALHRGRKKVDIKCPRCAEALAENEEYRTFFSGGYSTDGKESYGKIFIVVRKCPSCEMEYHRVYHKLSVSPSQIKSVLFNEKGFREFLKNTKTYSEEEFQKILEQARQKVQAHNELYGFK